ncbi:hypothetical protein GOBAR_AA18799 [Gossypium barbadense]|uniref:Uncharacterized protein n=1 Tax=Gossypium barbadense TaxID=3634 RepID=A0A2P5XEX2_GOSBA|nr:hypothetical protein GOBAR_AA18799 [Gossypium barbadense]
MLSKFISVSETCFQNTEIALKNQQASIQGLETQIGQLSKLISERPQGSLPSNTEPNPREHLNAISTQNKDRLIAPEPEIQQNNAMNKGREEVNNNDPKQVRTPSNKDNGDSALLSCREQRNPEERRLQIEELDEWRAHKSRTHDKPKLRQNKPDTSPNQLQVGDKVFLDATDPHIVTTTPNEEIPLTVLSIFPFDTVEVSHPKFGTCKHTWPGTRASLKPWPNRGRDTAVRYDRVEAGHDFPKTWDVINPHGRMTWPCDMAVGELDRKNMGVGIENHGRARDKARFCFFDTSVRLARAIQPCTIIHERPTIKHGRGRSKKAAAPFSKRRRGPGSSQYVLQPKFGTHSLNFRKLRRRSYFRYYAHDPSPQVTASTGLP